VIPDRVTRAARRPRRSGALWIVLALLVPAAARADGALYWLRRDAQLVTVDPLTGAELHRVRLSLPDRTVVGARGMAVHPQTGVLHALLAVDDACLDPERTLFVQGDQACRLLSRESCETAYHIDARGEPASCFWDGDECRGCGRNNQLRALCTDDCHVPPACEGTARTTFLGAGPDACRQLDGEAVACAGAYHLGIPGAAACFDDGGLCRGCDPAAEAAGLCARECAARVGCTDPARTLFTGMSFGGADGGCRHLDGDEAACAIAYEEYAGEPDSCVFVAGECLSSAMAGEVGVIAPNVCTPPPPECDGDPARVYAGNCNLLAEDQDACEMSYEASGGGAVGCEFPFDFCVSCAIPQPGCVNACDPPACSGEPARVLAGVGGEQCRAFDGDPGGCAGAFVVTRCGEAPCIYDADAGECRACRIDDPDGCANTCGPFDRLADVDGGSVLVHVDPVSGQATALADLGDVFEQLVFDQAGTPLTTFGPLGACFDLDGSALYAVLPSPVPRIALDPARPGPFGLDTDGGALYQLARDQIGSADPALVRFGPSGPESSVPLPAEFFGFPSVIAYSSACGAFLGAAGFQSRLERIDLDGSTTQLAYRLPGDCDDAECHPAGLAVTAGAECPPPFVTTTTTSTSSSTTTTTLPNERLAGTKLVLKDRIGKPSKRRLLVLAKGSPLPLGGGSGSADDPTLHGASLRMVASSGSFDVTYPLDDGWRLLRKTGQTRGYKRRGRGPIRKVVVKADTLLRIAGRGAALEHSLLTDPGTVAVELRLGAHFWCLEFGGTARTRSSKSLILEDAAPATFCPTAAP